MNIEEFMKHLYGPTATQSLQGGGEELYREIIRNDNDMKLSNATLGRTIGKELVLDESKNRGAKSFGKDISRSLEEAEANEVDDVENMEGGDYEAPKSLASIISDELLRMNGGKGSKKPSKKPQNRRSMKQRGGAQQLFPIAASFEYIEGKNKEQSEDIKAFMDTFMLYYRVSRAPSSAIIILPPHEEIESMKKAFEKYCKDTLKVPSNSIEAENALVSGDFQEWRNYLFYVYTKGDNMEYRIDPIQNGGPDAYPNSTISVAMTVFKRANLNSYVWYLKFDTEKNCFFLYPDEDFKKTNRIELELIGMAKQGKYMFQAKKPIPKNTTNKLDITKQSITQMLDTTTISGGGKNSKDDFKKYPINNLVRNWQQYGLQRGSEMSLCEMYKTSPYQVSENLGSNLVHSAILSALDDIEPQNVDSQEEYDKLAKEMCDKWKPVRNSMRSSMKGGLRLEKGLNLKQLVDSVAQQYPSKVRPNIIKADLISALIGGGEEPDMAFSEIDYSAHRSDVKRLSNALEHHQFEYFNSKEHPPLFSNVSNDDAKTVSRENSKESSEGNDSENPQTKGDKNDIKTIYENDADNSEIEDVQELSENEMNGGGSDSETSEEEEEEQKTEEQKAEEKTEEQDGVDDEKQDDEANFEAADEASADDEQQSGGSKKSKKPSKSSSKSSSKSAPKKSRMSIWY